MKLLAILLVIGLAGCASISPKPMTYEQLAGIQVSNADCSRIDYIIDNMNQQLKLKGILGVNPENLSAEDRRYNEKAKIIIWSLIIGCNNPDRYK